MSYQSVASSQPILVVEAPSSVAPNFFSTISWKWVFIFASHLLIFAFSVATEAMLVTGFVPLIPMVLLAAPAFHILLCFATFILIFKEVSENKYARSQMCPHAF
jgi:hypothetical protein